MKGYKAFDENLKCRDMQYEVGKTYEMDGSPVCCERGFHFCKDLAAVYNYYPLSDKTRICEVSAQGEIVQKDRKYCTNKIKILREIESKSIKHCNVDGSEVGFFNSGSGNSGDRNSGCDNSGSYNSGSGNSGSGNSGCRNSGCDNSGCYNSGSGNSGSGNSGCYNSGSYNSGSLNLGSVNSGCANSGCRNSGSYNSGDGNSGDWNYANYSSGCFCTATPEMLLFDKPSGMTLEQFRKTEAYKILSGMPHDAKYSDWDSDEEKIVVIEEKADAQGWYDNLSEKWKTLIKSMPNFDAEKFKKCTGINV